MNKTEIVACIYKHVGRLGDLENLTELAEEIARMAAEEEREACAKVCRDKKPWGNAADDWAARLLEDAASEIEKRSNSN